MCMSENISLYAGPFLWAILRVGGGGELQGITGPAGKEERTQKKMKKGGEGKGEGKGVASDR